MDVMNKLEKTVLFWVKDVPHLPVSARKWLALNVWWMVFTVAALSGLVFLSDLFGLFSQIGQLSAPSRAYLVDDSYLTVSIFINAIALFFVFVIGLLLALAVTPLKERRKKGWVLLFVALLVQALAFAVSAVLTFSLAAFIIVILFGGIVLGIATYFVFEIHGQFAHLVRKSKKT